MRLTGRVASFAFVLVASAVYALPASGQDYTPYIQITEGSVICKQGLIGMASGPLLAYDAWIKDPRQTQVGGDSKWTYSYRLDGLYSINPATSGIYTCYARYSVNGSDIGTLEQSKFINTCGDHRGEIIGEYAQYNVNITPECYEFATTGGSANFSWSELNGGFAGGNPHNPWGLVTNGLTDGLEQTRWNYNRGGINLTSGYRCPHGNASVGGVQNSYHVHGRAGDMYSSNHPWTEAEFDLLRNAALLTGTIELLFWNSYPDHHLHAAW
ncbi:MAG: hypothetical protein IT178_10970 [Acidobacteria bacterium]|nr:hypothetical protein [Acidobacteriota bacterium]